MFYRMRMALSRFMQGRYGMDSLNFFIFGAYFVTLLINLILRVIPGLTAAYLTVYLVGVALLVVWAFRMLSRNIYKRQAENYKYKAIKSKFLGFFRTRKARFSDRKTHVYRHCPNCRATVRLPRKKGRHTCTCPKCRNDFKVRICV